MREYETVPATVAPAQAKQPAAPPPKPKLFGPSAVEEGGTNSDLEMVWDDRTATFKTSKSKQPARMDPYEKRREDSENASHAAMNAELKIFAAELDAAGQQLLLDLAIINADKPINIPTWEGTSRVGVRSSRTWWTRSTRRTVGQRGA